MAATATAHLRPATAGPRDRIFYTGMSLAAIVTVFVGFAPTYYLKSQFQNLPLTPLIHAHGLVFTSWILLFLMQTVLVANRRVDIHRRLGYAGAALAVMLVVLGVTTAIAAVKRNSPLFGSDPLAFMVVPFGDMLVFSVLAGAGIWYRRNPETHKRLMLLATIAILTAAIARWPLQIMQAGPVAFFGITDLFIVAGVLYDLVSRRRVYPAYLWGGGLIVISQPLRLIISGTDAWHQFAAALVR